MKENKLAELSMDFSVQIFNLVKDLKRARETAEIIAEFMNLPVTFLPRFRETNNGVLAGMPQAEGGFTW